jgi:regulator of protease activity HflC (stomatin/prohibitin superfamily)
MVTVMAAVWLAAGLGWVAGAWSGILAITVPSLIILLSGLLTLPSHVLPVPPLPWKGPTVAAFLYTLVWLLSLWAGWLEMDVIGLLVLLPGLLVIFRPAFPMENAQPLVAAILLGAYGFIVFLIWAVLRGFEINNARNLLVLVQGVLALSCYLLPMTGKGRSWILQLALLYGMACLAVISLGLIDATLTNSIILLVGLLAVLRFLVPNKDEAEQWAEYLESHADTRLTKALQQYVWRRSSADDGALEVIRRTISMMQDLVVALIFFSYALAWAVGLALEDLSVTWLNVLIFTTGLAAIFLPVFVKPTKNWEALKAIITYNLGTNYPYVAVPFREVVTRAEGNAFRRLLAGPGVVLTAADHAVAVSSGDNFRRVSSPGVTFTHRMEQVQEVVDLRPQVRIMSPVVAKTKDGIDVDVDVFVTFRVATNGKEPELGRSFPYDEATIHKVVHAQRVDRHVGRKQGWDRLVRQACERAVRDIVAEYKLDELSSLYDPARDPRAEVAVRMRDKVRAQIEEWGLELLGGGIGNFTPPQRVIEQRIEHWKAHWERKIRNLEAEAEADERRRIEIARAEAQMEMILRLTEGLEQLATLEPDRWNELIALRLLDVIGQAGAGDLGLVPQLGSTIDEIRDSLEPRTSEQDAAGGDDD